MTEANIYKIIRILELLEHRKLAKDLLIFWLGYKTKKK